MNGGLSFIIRDRTLVLYILLPISAITMALFGYKLQIGLNGCYSSSVPLWNKADHRQVSDILIFRKKISTVRATTCNYIFKKAYGVDPN